MKAYIFFSTFCAVIRFTCCAPSLNLSSFLVSFIKSEHRPTTLAISNGICENDTTLLTVWRSLLQSGVPVTQSWRSLGWSLHHLLILVDFDCSSAFELMNKAQEEDMFRAPHRWMWLVGSDTYDGGEFQNLLERIDILVDSQLVIVVKKKDYFILYEAYKIAPHLEVMKDVIGSWQANLLVDYRRGSTSSRRRDLRGHEINIANVIADSNETRFHLEDRLDLHHDSISKMSWMASSTCVRSLNGTPRAVFVPTWGYRDRLGNWNGMIYNLTQKQVELGTLLIFTQERSQVLRYIAMIGTTSVRFVFRQPPLSYVSNIYALPFSRGVWLGTLLCGMLSACVLYATSRWERKVVEHPTQLSGSWGDVLILTVSAVMQQGCVLEPRNASGRILTFFLFAVLMAMYAAYSANIVVLLRAPSSSVRSLADLLHSPLDCGASDLDYNKYFFKQLNEPIRKKIYDEKIAPKGKKPHFYTMEEGVERIRQGLFAFHMEVNPGYRLIQDTYQENEKCDLVEMKYINEFDPWMPARIDSPFLDLFKIGLYRYRESGLQQANQRRLTIPRPKCSGDVSSFFSVGIIDTYPGLVMMLYGFLAALLVLLLEIVVHKLSRRSASPA